MGVYDFAELFLIGFYAFAATNYFVLWLGARHDRAVLAVSLMCAHGAVVGTIVLRLASVDSLAEGQRLLDARAAFATMGPVIAVWLFALLSGLRPRWYLWLVSGVFGAATIAQLAGAQLTGVVTGIEQVSFPWGERVTVLERSVATPWLLPLYVLAISTLAFGLVATRALWRRDRASGVLLGAAACVWLWTAILAASIDVAGLRLPYVANLVGPLFVVLIALQFARRARMREEALGVAERRFQAILDQALQFIGLLDPRGTLLEINRPALAFGRLTREAVVGRPFWETALWTHSPELQVELREAVARARTGEIVRFESTHPGPDGRVHHVETSIKPVRDASGAVTLLIPEGSDVTARREAEDALRASEARFRRLIQNQSDFVVSCRPDGAITFANDSFVAFLGLTAEATAGRSFLSLLDEASRGGLEPQLRALTPEAPLFSGQLVILAEGLEPRWTQWTGCGLYDAEGRLLSLQMTGRDVHDRADAEEESRQMERRIVDSQKMEALGQLAGGIAHDFNNLLTVITGRTDMLLAEHSGDPQRNSLLQIRQAAARAASMTRQLLAFSQQAPQQVQVVSPNSVLDEMQALLRQTVGERVALTVRTSPGLGRVRADPDQLARVILNLAVNARDAMPEGVDLRIETANDTLGEADGARTGLEPGPYVRLTVADTGAGMAEEIRTRLFEPFFTTKSPEQGTGLGLAVADGIIRQSGGAIDVKSAPGRGTTFTIYLPAVEHDVVRAEHEPASGGAGGGAEMVLLVEDEQAVREMTRAALRRLGYTVLTAATGEEGLAIARQHQGELALVLTDVVMPGMRGPEMAERLRHEQPDVAVLFMSGYTADTDLLRDVATGEAPFLQKPFNLTALGAKVRELLDRRRTR